MAATGAATGITVIANAVVGKSALSERPRLIPHCDPRSASCVWFWDLAPDAWVIAIGRKAPVRIRRPAQRGPHQRPCWRRSPSERPQLENTWPCNALPPETPRKVIWVVSDMVSGVLSAAETALFSAVAAADAP
jgi:hypothetical protein